MRKLRVTLCFLFVFFAAPMQSACKKEEGKTPAISYEIRLEYFPEEAKLRCVEVVAFENRTSLVFDSLKFNLYTNAYRKDAEYFPVSTDAEEEAFYAGKSYATTEIESVVCEKSTEGQWEICGEDGNILKIPLDEPLCHGESVSTEIEFSVSLPRVNHRFGVSDGAVNLGNFFPTLCGVFEEAGGDGGGFYECVYAPYGRPFVSDCANFTVSVALPKGFTVAASGQETEKVEAEGKEKRTYRLENARDFALCFSKKFEVATDTAEAGGRKIVVNYFYENDAFPQKTLDCARRALEYYSSEYATYPYGEFSLVETGLCLEGATYPALCLLPKNYKEEERVFSVAKEVARQWWYALVGSNEDFEAWQSEGLAEYSAACFFEKYGEYGRNKKEIVARAEKEYRAYYDLLSVLREKDTKMSRLLRSFASEREYRAIARDKGLMLFSALERSVGEKRMRKALREYAEEQSYALASPADLIAAFEKSGVDVSELILSFTEGKAIV